MGRRPIERFCKRCGKSLGFYTRRKYCLDCLKEVVVENITSLREKRGPIYVKWLRNIKRGILSITEDPRELQRKWKKKTLMALRKLGA